MNETDIAAAMERSIHHLINDYADCLNSDELERWPELFLEDGNYFILSKENIDAGLDGGYWMYCTSRAMMRDRVTSLRHITEFNDFYYRHMISNIKIKAGDNKEFEVRSNFFVVLVSYEGKFDSVIAGEYRDKIVESEGKLKFKERLVIPDTFHAVSSIVKPL